MKAFNSITAGCVLLVLACAGTIPAQTVVRIAGSTAFRAATLTALTHILSVDPLHPPIYGYVGSTFTKANQVIFTGSIVNPATHQLIRVIVKTAFAGSVGGIADLTQNLTVGPGGTAYPNGGGGWLVNSTPQSTTGTANVPANFDPATTPDVAMSDTYQKTTPFTSPALTDTLVAVIPFVWVKSLGNPGTVFVPFNFNKTTAANLLNGALTNIQCIGRDEDSGERLIAYVFAGISGSGFAQTPANQYRPTIAGGNIIGTVPWPGPVIVDGITYANNGHSGYASGSALATTLNTPTRAGITTGYVGYFGVNDANDVNGGHNNLEWNGVSYTPAAVQKGQYDLWSYEHVLYRSTFTGTGKALADKLALGILNFYANISGVFIETMSFHRKYDGGTLIPGDE